MNVLSAASGRHGTANACDKAEAEEGCEKGATGKSCDKRSMALRQFAFSITVATVLGHTVLGFEQAYATPVLAVLAAVATEAVLESVDAAAGRRRPRWLAPAGRVTDFFLPAYIGGLACAMLLYSGSNISATVLAAVVGVSSKYLIRIRVRGAGRHVLNPSNTGIVAVLLLFPWVGIAPPYQFTEWLPGWWAAVPPAVVLVLGSMLNGKLTGRMPLILGWVGGFVLQALVRGAFTDVSTISALLPVTGSAFVLFTNYMITDPGTTPSRTRNQVVFGLTAAAVYGLLVQVHIVFGFFFALVITCALRGAVLVGLDLRRPRRIPQPRVEQTSARRRLTVDAVDAAGAVEAS
ncbi:enediyne biosynthesis protein UnbU [Actinocrinis sp.]|uniref:enediyne biosynthesis protein UnbU n=1 Tax=Actinocrinis sp. TaxID=1920516 RepID=UPI002DDD2141|nr:enediyne biosynthesis protein UnbU [Actinocrinis sp.]